MTPQHAARQVFLNSRPGGESEESAPQHENEESNGRSKQVRPYHFKPDRLDCLRTFFSGSDTDDFLHRSDKDLAVTDLSRARLWRWLRPVAEPSRRIRESES